MNRLLLTTVVATVATLAAPTAARADFILDSFSTPTTPADYFISKLDANPFTRTDTAVSPGVDRTIMVTVDAPPLNTTSASGIIGGGLFRSTSDDVSKVTSKIEYTLSGSAANLSTASGLDLGFISLDAGTTASATAIQIDVLSKNGSLTYSEMIPASTGAFTRSYDFGAFSKTGAFDPSMVNTIRITINGGSPQTAVDFSMDEIRVRTALPAPPALVLAGIGLIGLIGRSRLRRPTA